MQRNPSSTAIDPSLKSAQSVEISPFRSLPATGVVYASKKATELGWKSTDEKWCNLGQGEAETGPLPGGPPRVSSLEFESSDHRYSPVLGIQDLRAAVAQFYNKSFRSGLSSQYSAENVAIAGGGRMALTRAVACLGQLNLGHFLPDYTAYEELIESFWLVNPIPILLSRDRAFNFTAQDLRKEITGRGLRALMLSNPSNPTGRLISGDQLSQWVQACKELDCTLLLDEFYSHYIWDAGPEEKGNMVSAASRVEDVNRDPVVLFDGLSKNWRYPGWRISWTVGPKKIIESIGNAGSFLDGGAPRPLQRHTIDLLDIESTQRETQAIQREFRKKRRLILDRCNEIGLQVDRPPAGGFYAFASLRNLDEGLREGTRFFQEALAHKVITVPGIYFDINPGNRRPKRRFDQHIRLSFGPPLETIARGMDRLESMIASYQREGARLHV